MGSLFGTKSILNQFNSASSKVGLGVDLNSLTSNIRTSIKPNYLTTFSLRNIGLFLTQPLHTKDQKNPNTFKYLFKKQLFSFLYPNQVRNNLMFRKKKLLYYSLVYKNLRKFKDRDYFSFTSFKKQFKLHYLTQVNLTNNVYNLSNPVTSLMKFSSSAFALNSNDSSSIEYLENYQSRGLDNGFKVSEVRIPRVRFKPGYQRL